ncbi:FkbM family methyltransferase [Pseudoflavitalea rhizosphaerae]|uniref:FkbM family methyltransferase n=1 Tax=Pseudoflavitalea rhizosphaerae TaxID=1884793 RepID=UPI000F8D0F2D|nr:FkbM family methyltransferase [Pseudoflavitalea rhizosphaerae]
MKKFIRYLLGYFGYDIIKVVPTSFLKKEQPVKVGNYLITLPVQNPLIKTYATQKDFASEIGRLAGYVLQKYPDLIFIDIGANTGDTIATVKSVQDIPILAVEGDDFSFSYLKRNAAQFRNVHLVQQFLGEETGTIKVDLQKKGWNTTIIPNAGNEEVTIKTLDTVVQESSLSKHAMKLLKIDTEGFDTVIIRGAASLIKETRPVIYFEYNRDNMGAIHENGLQTLLDLAREGYEKVLFFDDRGRYILSGSLSDRELIQDLHDYSDGKTSLIYYYNICLVHSSDADLANRIITGERGFRNAQQPSK